LHLPFAICAMQHHKRFAAFDWLWTIARHVLRIDL
jgi:hypothetical protein